MGSVIFISEIFNFYLIVSKLPIYFLVVNCLSMTGKPMVMVENCINGALQSLRLNPHAYETSVICVIAYGNNKVSFLEEYTCLNSVQFQKFKCSGYSNINYGLKAVEDDYNKNYIATTKDKKDDWEPMLFVFSGLAPSTKIDYTLIDFFEEDFPTDILTM